MDELVREMLYQDKDYLRHYCINDSQYLFDNKDMKLYKVRGNSNQKEKFVPRDSISLPISKPIPRAIYDGLTAIIELTDKCNLSCVYCYRQEQLDSNFLEMDTAETILSHFIKLDKEKSVSGDTIRVVFFGGEPLLNFKTLKFLVTELNKKIKNYIVKYNISTNGVLLSPDKLDFLVAHRFTIQISFEGEEIAQGKNRPFTNGTNSYSDIITNLSHINRRSKDLITLAMSISKTTLDIDKTILRYVEQGYSKFNILFIVDDIINKINLTFEDIDFIKDCIHKITKVYFSLIKERKNVTIHPFYENLTYLHTRIPRGICSSTKTTEAIGSDGKIYPCQRFLSIKEFNYGTTQQGYDQEKLLKIRDEKCYYPEECSSCWVKNFCSGKCAYLRTIPSREEKGYIGCVIQSTLWDEIIKGYILLKENEEEALFEFFKNKIV